MKAFAIITKGMEDFALSEIKSILNSELDVEIYSNVFIFEVNSYADIAKLCYLSKSFFKFGFLIQSIKLDEINFDGDYTSFFKNADFSIFEDLKLDSHSMATRVRSFNSEFDGKEMERAVGGTIANKFNIKVDLKTPSLSFFCYFSDRFICGLDFSLIDLSKREYKLHNSLNSLKGSLAYATQKFADIKSGDRVLDPFCEVGILLIESYLDNANMSTNYYRKNLFGFNKFREIFDNGFKLDQFDDIKSVKTHYFGYDSLLKNVLFSQKNSKVMGIKDILFSRVDVSDIDLKHEENSIDVIMSNPSFSFKNNNMVKKLQSFLDVSYSILKKGGRLILIGNNIKQILKLEHEFNLVETREFSIGKEHFYLIKLQK